MNNYYDFKFVGAVVLVAGRGSRFGADNIPKAMYMLGGVLMILYIVDLLERIGIPRE